MPLWQRLLITLAVMLLASYLVGLLWQWMFTADIPSYLSGAVGGISAGADMGVLAEDPSEALAPKTYLRCYSEPVMSDREIADIDLLLQSLSGRGNPKNIAILDNRPVSVRAP